MKGTTTIIANPIRYMLASPRKASDARQSTLSSGSSTTQRQRPRTPGPSVSETFSYLLVPLDLLNRLMSTLLSPLLAHVVNSIILLGLGFLAIYFLLPFLLSQFKWGLVGSLRVFWNLARGKGTGISFPSVSSLKNVSPAAIYGAMRATGGLCSSVYLPLLCARKTQGETYDVGKVARALHKEGLHVKIAAETFGSTLIIRTPSSSECTKYLRVGHKSWNGRSREWPLPYQVSPARWFPVDCQLTSTLAECGNLLLPSKSDRTCPIRTSWERN
jgi:hypothetical protein